MAKEVIFRKTEKGCMAMFPYDLNESGQCKCFNGKRWEYREYLDVIRETKPARYSDFRKLQIALADDYGLKKLEIKAKRNPKRLAEDVCLLRLPKQAV